MQFYRIWPFSNRLRKILGSSSSLNDAATEVAEIYPAVEELSPRIHALPGQEARVTHGADGLNRGRQLAYFRRHPVVHKAVIRYEIPDVFVFANGFVTRGGTFNRDGSRFDLAGMLSGKVSRLDRAHYCMEDRSYRYFGHWLRQFSTRIMVEGDGVPVIHRPHDSWRDAALWEELLDMPRSPDRQQFVERLFCYQDHAQGPHKRARYRIMADRLAAALAARETAADRAETAGRVYLRRPGGGEARDLDDEAGFIRRLEAEGFRILDQERQGTPAVLQALRRAREVVTMEGSHVDPVPFLMPEGGVLVILNPADRFNVGHMARAACFGLRTATVVIEPVRQGAYRADPGEVIETLALAGAERAESIGWEPLGTACSA